MSRTKEEEEAAHAVTSLVRRRSGGRPGDPRRRCPGAKTNPRESTIDRIKRAKVLRIAALPGEAPYFNKDIATGAWSGMCIEMAKDIAGVFDGQGRISRIDLRQFGARSAGQQDRSGFRAEPDAEAGARHRFHARRSTCTASAWSARRAFTPTNWSRPQQARGQGRGRYRLGARDRGAPLCAKGDDHRIEDARRMHPRSADRAGPIA